MASNILITTEILNTLTHSSFGCFSSSPLDFPRSIKFNSFDITHTHTHTCENVWLHKEIIHIHEDMIAKYCAILEIDKKRQNHFFVIL